MKSRTAFFPNETFGGRIVWVQTTNFSPYFRNSVVIYTRPSTSFVSKLRIRVRINPISLRVFSKITLGSLEAHRRQLGAITIARLFASILVIRALSRRVKPCNKKMRRQSFLTGVKLSGSWVVLYASGYCMSLSSYYPISSFPNPFITPSLHYPNPSLPQLFITHIGFVCQYNNNNNIALWSGMTNAVLQVSGPF